MLPADIETGTSYFPLETGQYREYDIREINYRFDGSIDTATFQLREEVAGNFTNDDGTLTWLLQRFTRPNSNNNWRLDSVWTARRSAFGAIVTENNVAFQRLAFPVQEGLSWNGNAFNTLPNQTYQLVQVNQPFVVNNIRYDSTVTVIQNNLDDPIVGQNIQTEIYARNIGLINKQSIILQFCTEVECLGQGVIEIGRDFQQRLVANGKE